MLKDEMLPIGFSPGRDQLPVTAFYKLGSMNFCRSISRDPEESGKSKASANMASGNAILDLMETSRGFSSQYPSLKE